MTRSGDRLAGAVVVRFGTFQVNLRERELYKRGVRLKLQQKPFQILELLLERPGELITRNAIRDRLWPGLHVSFERSLNTAVNTLRQTLGDSPRNPRFIETRPGLGYRFIAPVERVVFQRTGETPSRSSEFEDYVKGRYFYNKATEESLRLSVAHFNACLEAEPRHAKSHAGLADAHMLLACFHTAPPRAAFQAATEHARTAVRMDAQSAEAHAALGAVSWLKDWDRDRAEEHFARALALDANCATALQWYADYLCSTGRVDEALAHMRRALQVDAVSPLLNMRMAWALYMARDFEGALVQSWKTLAVEPNFAAAQHALGLAHGQLGDTSEARIELRNACSCSGGHPIPLASLGHAYAVSGDEEEARKILRQLEQMSATRSISPYWSALVYAGLRETSRALEALARGFDVRDPWIVWVGVDPRFDSLRRHPAFAHLPEARSSVAV